MIRNAVQYSENVRNSLVLNYKSAALSGGAAGAKLGEICARTEPTLYFSARGSGAQFHHCWLHRCSSVRNVMVAS
jgi:hypothetical protein